MTEEHSRRPDLPILEHRWRLWSSIAVLAVLLSGVLLGLLVIPVVQGKGAGIDAYTAICRALGIFPGSPARPQPINQAAPTPVSQVVWTPDLLQVWANADPRSALAMVQQVCSSCHGETGVSVSQDFPNLAGQSGAAIYKQLHDYRSGSRSHSIMTDIAKSLEEPALGAVAAYYASRPQRNPNPATLAESAPAIVRLVELGDPQRNLPACAACHREGAGGPIETPVLAEQRQDYLIDELKMFASGERHNDVYARMRSVAPKLSEGEIRGLARYYAAGFR